VLLLPEGASLTDVTFIVRVRATASLSTPPFATPPSSCTWKVKLAYAAPLWLGAGVNLKPPAATAAADTDCPLVTAMPASVSVPAAGSVAIFTLSSAFASFGSV
jgi:hypothetical protein